jgi:DNA-binding NarL/FixJ family response regulator
MTERTHDAGTPSATIRESIAVAIIEDHHELRESLAALVGGTEGFRCVGSFHSMEAALEGIGRFQPDVALVDIGLPGMSGIEGIGILRERHPSVLRLVLTIHDDDDRIFEALCAGATGYLLKKTPPARLLESLQEAVEGGSPMSPEVARKVITLFRRVRPPRKADYDLTPHESRILAMLVEGHNRNSAAAELGVSPATIAFHVKHIYEKLQVHSKSEAVVKALRDGLID